MKRTALIIAALLCLWLPGAARAEVGTTLDTGGGSGGGEQGWLLNGSTLGEGRTAFHGQLGWPGLNLSILRGMSDQVDLGGLFAFNFGVEGMTGPGAVPGLRFGGLLRVGLMDTARFNLGLRVSPAMVLYFFSGATVFGFAIPIEVVAGLPITPQFEVHFGMGLPMTIELTPTAAFVLSFLPGVGIEYKLDHALSLTFDTAFGAAIQFGTYGGSSFQFRTLFGVGYRF